MMVGKPGGAVTWPSLLLVAVFVLSLPAVTPRLYASDEIEYFAYLRSLWFDQDLSFDNEYRYFYDAGIAQGTRPREGGTGFYGDLFSETFLEASTPTGLRPNFAPIGSAILWAPFYAVADLTARTMAWFGSQVPVDGYSRPYLVAVSYGSAVYGFLAVVLSVTVARRLIGLGHLAAFATWVGCSTPKTQAETVVEPDGVADDGWGKSVSAVAERLARHRPTLPPVAQLDNALWTYFHQGHNG